MLTILFGYIQIFVSFFFPKPQNLSAQVANPEEAPVDVLIKLHAEAVFSNLLIKNQITFGIIRIARSMNDSV